MSAELLIRGGTIVTSERTFAGDVRVRDGRIVEVIERPMEGSGGDARSGGGVRADGDARTGGDVSVGSDVRLGGDEPAVGDARAAGPANEENVLDATGMYVLPGLVDLHVHFRDPGLTDKEDFETGTAAAALGGVTTVLDMPNTKPPVGSASVLRQKAAAVAGRAYVDYKLYGVITEHNLPLLAEMAEAGAAAFKLFLGPTTGDIKAPGWGKLIEVFETVRDLNVPLVVHAEDRDVIEYWEKRAAQRTMGVGGGFWHDVYDFRPPSDEEYSTFLATRPRFGEAAATQTVCLLAAMTNTPVHIAHVSIKEAVDVIRQAKAAGAPVSAETCPQYLTLTSADCRRLGPVSKVLPPVREKADQEALWQALQDGVIDMIASDHAPHEAAAKESPSWSKAAAGLLGVQTMLLVLLNEAEQGRLTLNDLVRWASRRPAELFGFDDEKGDIRPGLDADLVVVDPRRETTVTAEWLQSKSKNSHLIGRTLRGAVVHTIVRGHVVVRDGRLTGLRIGRNLFERAPAPPPYV